jgi:large subunit ribosomal protein L9
MATYLLLLEDVDSLGRSGDIVHVKPGYARNYLLPQKKALIATTHTRRLQARLQEQRAQRALVDKTESEALAQDLQDKLFVVEVKVDPDGNLYGSVGHSDILSLFANEGITLERKNIALSHSIKSLGVHTVALRLKESVAASVKIKVVAEGHKDSQE